MLEADGYGDKVLHLVDGTFLKLFRRKRWLSSALLYPYATRFARNAEQLAIRNIPCPQVISVYRIPAIMRDAVHYRPLAGHTLRELRPSTATGLLQRELGKFVAKLHKNGVYFRSLHLGNIIKTPDGTLGLIDIADMRVQNRPLNLNQRLRNLRHLLRYENEREWLLSGDSSEFLSNYLESSKLNMSQHQLKSRILSQGIEK
ncbi:hypothetical protein D3C78_796180 [compost metagenome]